jgi:ABC-type uncharacterized transport system substrate-binding protein
LAPEFGPVPHGHEFHDPEMVPKRLELLPRPVPQVRTVALLVNPNKPNANPIIQNLEEAVRIKGLQLYILKAVTRDIDAAIASLVQSHAGAPVVGPDPLFSASN